MERVLERLDERAAPIVPEDNANAACGGYFDHISLMNGWVGGIHD